MTGNNYRLALLMFSLIRGPLSPGLYVITDNAMYQDMLSCSKDFCSLSFQCKLVGQDEDVCISLLNEESLE